MCMAGQHSYYIYVPDGIERVDKIVFGIIVSPILPSTEISKEITKRTLYHKTEDYDTYRLAQRLINV